MFDTKNSGLHEVHVFAVWMQVKQIVELHFRQAELKPVYVPFGQAKLEGEHVPLSNKLYLSGQDKQLDGDGPLHDSQLGEHAEHAT